MRRTIGAVVMFATAGFFVSCALGNDDSGSGDGGGKKTRDSTGSNEGAGGAGAITSGANGGARARAVLEGRSGSSLTGTVDFVQNGEQVTVTIAVRTGPPGNHGIHVHEGGSCSNPDAASAGGPFNPTMMAHGGINSPMHHAGTFGNMLIGASGNGMLVLTTNALTVTPGKTSVVGRTVVVHAKVDDLRSEPDGNAGERVGCGVITAMP